MRDLPPRIARAAALHWEILQAQGAGLCRTARGKGGEQSWEGSRRGNSKREGSEVKTLGTAEATGSGNSLQNKFLSGFWRKVLLDFVPGKSETFQIPARILQGQETWFLGLALS